MGRCVTCNTTQVATGPGKTSLAMLVSMAAEDAGRSVAIYSVPRLLAEIKETYEDGAGRSYQELFHSSVPSILVIAARLVASIASALLDACRNKPASDTRYQTSMASVERMASKVRHSTFIP